MDKTDKMMDGFLLCDYLEDNNEDYSGIYVSSEDEADEELYYERQLEEVKYQEQYENRCKNNPICNVCYKEEEEEKLNEKELNQQDNELNQEDNELNQEDNELNEKDNELNEQDNELNEQDNELNEQEYNEYGLNIDELNEQEYNEYGLNIDELNEQELNQEDNELNQQDNELNEEDNELNEQDNVLNEQVDNEFNEQVDNEFNEQVDNESKEDTDEEDNEIEIQLEELKALIIQIENKIDIIESNNSNMITTNFFINKKKYNDNLQEISILKNKKKDYEKSIEFIYRLQISIKYFQGH